VAEVIGVNWLLDAFMSVMAITEVLSVLRNMAELGWPVPSFAVKLAARAQSQIGRRLDALLGPQAPAPPIAPQPESG
jgi:phage-related holin